jgi:TPP-dependent pyruvate/acetoin dehydrogenase alpha subunit
LKGGSPKVLEQKILDGESISIMDKSINFLSTGIVCGGAGIAVGLSWALKRVGGAQSGRVWCFIGDGAEDEGHFYEAVRYVDGWDLPCTFVIEDNNLSVDTPKRERYGKNKMKWGKCVIRYEYVRKYPHVQTGKIVRSYM